MYDSRRILRWVDKGLVGWKNRGGESVGGSQEKITDGMIKLVSVVSKFSWRWGTRQRHPQKNEKGTKGNVM